jgi:hypothetical protein
MKSLLAFMFLSGIFADVDAYSMPLESELSNWKIRGFPAAKVTDTDGKSLNPRLEADVRKAEERRALELSCSVLCNKKVKDRESEDDVFSMPGREKQISQEKFKCSFEIVSIDADGLKAVCHLLRIFEPSPFETEIKTEFWQ